MKIEGETTFNAMPEKVWNVLLDPRVMSQCIPGCQKLAEAGVDRYAAILHISVGAVRGTFQGTLQIREKIRPCQYSMVFEGRGQQSFVKGSGEARLRGVNGSTVVAYKCDVEVGGLVASVGQRMLVGVSKMLVNQMFQSLRAAVDGAEGQ